MSIPRSIAFFAKGLRLLKEEKREKTLQAQRSGKNLSREDTIAGKSSSGAVIKIGFDSTSLEDGFVFNPDDDETELEGNHDGGNGDTEAAVFGSETADVNRGHAKPLQQQISSSSDQPLFFHTRPLQMKPTTDILTPRTSANKNGFGLLNEFDEEDEEEEGEEVGFEQSPRNQSGLHRSPFRSQSNLLSSKPQFRFKKLLFIPYKWVVILTVLGHAFLGIFMGFKIFFSFLSFLVLLSFFFFCILVSFS